MQRITYSVFCTWSFVYSGRSINILRTNHKTLICYIHIKISSFSFSFVQFYIASFYEVLMIYSPWNSMKLFISENLSLVFGCWLGQWCLCMKALMRTLQFTFPCASSLFSGKCDSQLSLICVARSKCAHAYSYFQITRSLKEMLGRVL